jgi:hypothetical protein
MAYRRSPLRRLDLLIIGASKSKLERDQEIPAVNAPVLTDEQQQELYRLNYRARVSTLSPAEEILRARLEQIRRGK